MSEQEHRKKEAAEPDKDPLSIANSPPANPVMPGIEPLSEPTILQQNLSAEHPGNEGAKNKKCGQGPFPDPLIARVIKQDGLGPFERATLRYARWGFGVGVVTLLVVTVTAYVFYQQFVEMAAQTDLLNISAAQARRDAKDAGITTARQLAAAQRQAQAAQDGANAIQKQTRTTERAWISIANIGREITVVENQPIVSSVRFENVGNTSARNVLFEVVIAVVKNGEDPKFEYQWDHIRGKAGIFLKNEPLDVTTQRFERKAVGPDGVVKPLSPDEYKDWIAGLNFVVVYAKVTYQDIFGTPHFATRCGWAAATAPRGTARHFTSQKCSAYGNVDNN